MSQESATLSSFEESSNDLYIMQYACKVALAFRGFHKCF